MPNRRQPAKIVQTKQLPSKFALKNSTEAEKQDRRKAVAASRAQRESSRIFARGREIIKAILEAWNEAQLNDLQAAQQVAQRTTIDQEFLARRQLIEQEMDALPILSTTWLNLARLRIHESEALSRKILHAEERKNLLDLTSDMESSARSILAYEEDASVAPEFAKFEMIKEESHARQNLVELQFQELEAVLLEHLNTSLTYTSLKISALRTTSVDLRVEAEKQRIKAQALLDYAYALDLKSASCKDDVDQVIGNFQLDLEIVEKYLSSRPSK